MDEIVKKEEVEWKFNGVEEAKKFTYSLRNALNYIYTHDVKPYSNAFGKVIQKEGKVNFTKDEKWEQVFDADDLLSPNAENFTDLVLWVMNNPDADNICITAVIISVEEQGMFNTWMEVNKFELLENTILRKKGGIEQEKAPDLSRPG